MLKLQTQDPYERGRILKDGVVVDQVPFDFVSLDANEWERLADEALQEYRYRRISPWRQDGCDVEPLP